LHVQALKSAQYAGLEVPAQTWFGAMKFLRKVSSPDGSRYGRTEPPAAKAAEDAAERTSAAGLLCRSYLGWTARDPALIKGSAEVRKVRLTALNPDVGFLYWTTNLLHRRNDEQWPAWHTATRDLLLQTQDLGKENAHQRGSWSAKGDEGAAEGGRLFATTMAVLTLETYYRQLPMMQREPPEPLGEAELIDAWQALSHQDRGQVQAALWSLVVASDRSLPFLRERLRPVARVDRGDPKELERLIGDLDSDDFDVREKASADLAAFGDLAEPALRKALEGKPSLEKLRRVEGLLERAAERKRAVRSLEVLEEVGSSEARALLERLVREGRVDAPLTREAKAALQRLARESPSHTER
jgi:hypothetical protein